MKTSIACITAILLLLGSVCTSSVFADKGSVQAQVSSSPAVSWEKTFGNGYLGTAYAVIQTSEGGYAVVGSRATGYSASSAFLVKTDPDGNMEWNQTYSMSSACAIIQTSDGGYMIAGNGGVMLTKTDATASPNGTKPTAEQQGQPQNALIHTSDNGYAIVGATSLLVRDHRNDVLVH
jgi:hypothetical protein